MGHGGRKKLDVSARKKIEKKNTEFIELTMYKLI